MITEAGAALVHIEIYAPSRTDWSGMKTPKHRPPIQKGSTTYPVALCSSPNAYIGNPYTCRCKTIRAHRHKKLRRTLESSSPAERPSDCLRQSANAMQVTIMKLDGNAAPFALAKFSPAALYTCVNR